jgi:hypothetical protein
MHPDEQFPHDEWRQEEYDRRAGVTEDSVYNVPPMGGQAIYTDPGAKIVIKPVPDISATLAERGGRYGQFIDHAKIAQGLQDVLRDADNWNKLDVDMKQALTVIADKMARILNGDPYYDDNWHDIQGYAKLVEDRIRKERGEQ